MKQHEVPESSLGGTAYQEPSTDLASPDDRVSAALKELAAECRFLLNQNAEASALLLDEIRAALAVGASFAEVTSLLPGSAAEPSATETLLSSLDSEKRRADEAPRGKAPIAKPDAGF
jgi:hypothetical protein